MSNKMKAYVCYEFDDSAPKKVFWYKKDAHKWIAEDEKNRACKEMEIE